MRYSSFPPSRPLSGTPFAVSSVDEGEVVFTLSSRSCLYLVNRHLLLVRKLVRDVKNVTNTRRDFSRRVTDSVLPTPRLVGGCYRWASLKEGSSKGEANGELFYIML